MGSRSRRRSPSKMAESKTWETKVSRVLTPTPVLKTTPPKSWYTYTRESVHIGGDRAPRVRLTKAERSANIKTRQARGKKLKSNATSLGSLDHAHKLLSGVKAEWS